jgi:hypothetical protein
MRTLPFPVFNAPGNHDRPGSELYQRSFGSQTYLQFRLGRSMFIVLDTQLDQGRISGPQQEWLLQWLQRARDDESIDNVFVFGHQLVWCVDHSLLSTIRPHINSKKYLHAGWFQTEVMPDLQQLAGQKGVYWFAGDIGATWSYSTFYWKQPDSRLHFVATGLGDTARDAVLRVDVAGNGHVTIVPVSLTAQEMLPIEAYGPEFWEVYFARQRALTELVAKSAQALPATTTPAVRRSLARVWLVITAAVLVGCVISWIAFRLVQSGWNRFKRLRIKYYSSSNRRVE